MTPKRTVVAHNWHCTTDTGAQVTVCGPALLTMLNVREANLIPVSHKVTTTNDVNMTILLAIVVKLTSVSSGVSTLQLCYITKECCGVYVSLNACRNQGIVHETFPQPAARLNFSEFIYISVLLSQDMLFNYRNPYPCTSASVCLVMSYVHATIYKLTYEGWEK